MFFPLYSLLHCELVIETELVYFQEKIEALSGNATIFPQDMFGQIPKVFDSIDIICFVVEQLAMINTKMPEVGLILDIIKY